LPFTAVFGRTFFPVRGKFFAIATSIYLGPVAVFARSSANSLSGLSLLQSSVRGQFE
jgi:hypothetical protein